MIVINNGKERERFLKFAAVGALGALIDFVVMNMLTQGADMPLVLAGTISFLCAVFNNFYWNRHWTYPDSRSRPVSQQLSMFFAVNIAGVAIRIPILHFIEPPLIKVMERMNFRAPLSPEFLAKNLTLALAVGIVMLWNYFVNRYWTYNDVD
jgi:putative flippase GtrA